MTFLRAVEDGEERVLGSGGLSALLRAVEADSADVARATPPLRWQDPLIIGAIPAGARVLDLGCGTGELLARLRDEQSVIGQGVELEVGEVFDCVARGVPVIQTDIDAGLSSFPSGSFDVVVLEETLQTLYYPMRILTEMLRVGRRGIISFPNFACWQVRLQILLKGTMPITARLPYHWYDTPNIHLCSVGDFLAWVAGAGVRVVAAHALEDGRTRPLRPDDEFHAEEALFIVEKPMV
jgi:methionine biosynthesis protein MetW